MIKEKIIYGKDYIQIKKADKELVYWVKQEWIDEPELVFSICNAIHLATENKLEESIKQFERRGI